MKTKRAALGELGESIVCRFLRSRGFVIVERNYLKPWGEVDIVAEKGGTTHFVEVKSVSRERGGGGGGVPPAENLHSEKMRRVSRAAHSYLREGRGGVQGNPWQIDAALVYVDIENKRAKIDIVGNVF